MGHLVPTFQKPSNTEQLSANPDAHDLANSRTPGPDTYNMYHSRTRSSHASMPQNLSNTTRLSQLGSPISENHGNGTQPRHFARHSLEGGFVFPPERDNEVKTPVPASRPTSLQSSYSTNDLPTVKGNGFDTAVTPPKTQTEQFHQHNASMGRIPNGAVNTRSSKNSPEFNGATISQPSQTMLQASAAPFGPQLTQAVPPNPGLTGNVVPSGLPFNPYGFGQPYVGQTPNPMAAFGAPNNYAGFANYGGGYRYNETPGRGGIVQRRQTESDSSQLTRYANFPLDHYKGELYSLCKDQHGCRYLQRKLEERTPEHVQLIFSETYMHVIELMTGMKKPLTSSNSWSKLTLS